MDLDKVKAVIELARDSGALELEVASGDESVRVVLGRAASAPVEPPPHIATAPQAPVTTQDPQLAVIEAPMAGTFYRSPHPDAEPFVELGAQVAADDVVCIIESMKMMHEIRAGRAGTVQQVCVDNGTPVATGEVLFRLS